MIFDHLDRASLYQNLHPRFAPAFDFVREVAAAPQRFADGRHELRGIELFALVERYSTAVITGREVMGFAPTTLLTPSEDFNLARDIQFYKPLAFADGAASALAMGQGDWVILYPDDGHMPRCNLGQTSEVLKVVCKILA